MDLVVSRYHCALKLTNSVIFSNKKLGTQW